MPSASELERADQEDEGFMEVSMHPDDWRRVAEEAVEHAIGWLHQADAMSRAGAIERAGSLLRAADAFNGRANMLELGSNFDFVTVEK